jgi:uncharacterized protein YndB with AHSA1/START domain
MATSKNKALSKPVFELTRVFEAPRERVWEAWSTADQLGKWWGPKGCSIEIGRFEFRPGGFCHYSMEYALTPKTWGRFNYREIAKPERLAWLNSFANENCGITRAPFSEFCPLEIQNTVTFEERNGTTVMSLRAEPFGETEEERSFFEELCTSRSLEKGYTGTCEALDAFLLEQRR